MALALTGHPSYMYYKTQGDALGYVLDAPSGRAFHRSFGSPCSFGSLVRSVPSFVRIYVTVRSVPLVRSDIRHRSSHLFRSDLQSERTEVVLVSTAILLPI